MHRNYAFSVMKQWFSLSQATNKSLQFCRPKQRQNDHNVKELR